MIRLNGYEFECGDAGRPGISWDIERKICTELGIEFNYFYAGDSANQPKMEAIFNQGNTWVHCRRGADRTGGAVGGWLHNVKGWSTERTWDYTTDYNSWNSQCLGNAESQRVFVKGGYLFQAKKFGVKDLADAQRLARLYPGGK